jgi:hypothetical protein
MKPQEALPFFRKPHGELTAEDVRKAKPDACIAAIDHLYALANFKTFRKASPDAEDLDEKKLLQRERLMTENGMYDKIDLLEAWFVKKTADAGKRADLEHVERALAMLERAKHSKPGVSVASEGGLMIMTHGLRSVGHPRARVRAAMKYAPQLEKEWKRRTGEPFEL